VLIVETLTANGSAAQAGLQEGDHLRSYNDHLLTSPALLSALSENAAGTDVNSLQLSRQGQEMMLSVPPGALGMEVRPVLSAEVLSLYQEAQAAWQADNLEMAGRLWQEAIQRASEPPVAAWIEMRLGSRYEQKKALVEALHAYDRAWKILETTDENALQYLCLLERGRCSISRSDFPQAEWDYQSARRLAVAARFPVWEAYCLNSLGIIAWNRGDLASAEEYVLRALQLRERFRIDSLEVATCLNNLGILTIKRGDISAAEDYYLRSLAIRKRLAPDSLYIADSLNSLGIVARLRGDISAAEEYHRGSLVIRERLAPDSLDVATSLSNLGVVAYDRGDLSAAEDYFRRSLALRERLASDTLSKAGLLNSLGIVAFNRGDLSAAEDYCLRSLALQERLAPDSLDVASSLSNLGMIAKLRGDLSAAEGYGLRSLALQERLAPDSLDVAESLNNLGEVADQRGDLSSAEHYYLRDLAISERLAPDSLHVAISLNNLGGAARKRGDLPSAEAYHRRALAIRERLAPNSLDVAVSLHGLADLYRQQQLPSQALPLYQRAIAIVESQRSQIASIEARSLLLAQHLDKYLGLLQVHLALGNLAEAFAVVERARARSLVEMLAERQLDFTHDAPAGLLQQQQELDQRRSQTYSALARLDANADTRQIQTLQAQLQDLERQQQQLTVQIRTASPRYATLQYPQPLDLAGVQEMLDPGTLALVYQTEETQTYLFAVTRDRCDLHRLPLGREELARRVGTFRSVLDVRLLENTLQELLTQGQSLYAALLAPVKTALKRANRLLLCPEGPLHVLPFACLVTNTGRKPRYLGEEIPMHQTVSLTVYAQIRQEKRKRRPAQNAGAFSERIGPGVSSLRQAGKRLLAFGDPLYPQVPHDLAPAGPCGLNLAPAGPAFATALSNEPASAGEGEPEDASPAEPPSFPVSATADLLTQERRALQSRGLTLSPLPHTRREIESIGRLFGDQALLRLGARATKTAARAESRQAAIVHFACHGWLDHRFPLSSALVLSQPEALGAQAPAGDNGLLQAWEVLEQMQLEADLVVLSACETGLGQEVRGEGLIGLTRAFQYAGARSVLVSLWEIHDASTSHFMQAFYEGLAEGCSKDDALQRGIAALRRHPEWSHPYYWGAFALQGDWEA
jgi:CHAT domain-containing protein/Tfp pilus assembly protein PilF